MTRVGGISGRVQMGSAQARQAASSAQFHVEDETALAAPAALQPAGLAGMLALQELESEGARDRKARKNGLAMLEALRDLQHTLLAASSTEDQIAGLASLAQSQPAADDPELNNVLSAIRLRARIELLRRGADPA